MKALVLEEYMKIVHQDWEEPRPGDEEVLIRVAACGICGSDIHGMDGSTGRRRPPIIMGHEASGTIVDVGRAVAGWKAGDRVTFDSTVYCGHCWYCRRGDINLCDNRMVLGVSCEDYRRHGAFAEYVTVPQHILYRIPDGVSFEKATLIEALSIAVHGVSRVRPEVGEAAVVVGAGMIGLLVLQVLRVAGCGLLAAVDVDAGRLEIAKKLGADIAVKSDTEDAPAVLRSVTGGRGADLVVEAVGLEAAVGTALNVVRKGGRVSLVGNLSPSIGFPLQVAVTRELSIMGSCASRGEYPACLDLIDRGRIDTGAIISAVAPLSEGASWFGRLHRREAGLMKVVLRP